MRKLHIVNMPFCSALFLKTAIKAAEILSISSFCQEGWHRPALSLFAKVSLVFSCKLPKSACSQKFAFAQRSGAMKAPVGLLSDRTVLRVGEATGLRWCDVDLEEGTISVNHTLVNYDHRENNGGKKGCYFNCHSPKTKAGVRTVPMMDFVKEAFEKGRAYQKEAEIHCTVTVDGYTDFIFVNRFGECQHQGTLNKAIRRIIRDCNDEVLAKNPNSTVLLPRFSCHTLRHTFTTRMCEAGVNIKVIQDALGHSDISTTLNIYADVTKELRKSEFENLDRQFAQWKDPEE